LNSRPLARLSRRFEKELLRLRMRYLLSAPARKEMAHEKESPTAEDIPITSFIDEGLAWIGRAQDHSRSADGGVARHFCLLSGWGPSYPETTGYIIPTLIREGRIRGDINLLNRSRKMLDWLLSIQLPTGAFQGGTIDTATPVPVTFNTGQILLGLTAGTVEFGSAYETSMMASADWLVSNQDRDGCWRKFPTPYASPGEKTYETHVAWGLLEAARLLPDRGYAEAAIRNVYWAMGQQSAEGWFPDCCLNNSTNPLTHTIGYILRGLVEAYLFTGDGKILESANRCAKGALRAMRSDGYLPGRLDSRWQGSVSWSCLTGTQQLAICWLLLYRKTGNTQFRDAAFLANRFVRRTVRLDGPMETRGAVKGSFPVKGEYSQFQYPNWACKFFLDAQRLELDVRVDESEAAASRGVGASCSAG
jgi:hypothetical protein